MVVVAASHTEHPATRRHRKRHQAKHLANAIVAIAAVAALVYFLKQ